MFKFLKQAIILVLFLVNATGLKAQVIKIPDSEKNNSQIRERIAQNILIYQRSVGGWAKHVNDVKIDYTKELSEGQIAAIKDDAFRNDATIDNEATVKEIRFLAEQFKLTKNEAYLKSAEKGLSYLLKAQYSNGGWPQFFPDTSNYRKQITYNDNAMVNVLNLFQDVVQGFNHLEVIKKTFQKPLSQAIDKSINCILNSQVMVNGKLTAWCAQHDKVTLKPTKARSFELVSLSGMETVGIVEFLMRQKNPSDKIKASVKAGAEWLKAVKISGFKYANVPDSAKSKGFDRFLQKDPDGETWARFYEVETNEPFFCGRDGVKHKSVLDIEYERRVGYAYYGNWPKELLDTKYPTWASINLKNSVSAK